MTTVNFGVGTLIGRRTDIANASPAFMGIAQDCEISFDQTLKELVGQYKMPVDVAAAQLKVTGKAKFARIQANALNDLILGQTLTTGAGEQMAVAEAATIATTVTVAHAATFVHDLGVFHALTGVQFTRVASAPTVGQYSVVETTGVYTFNATDVGVAATFYYSYTVTTMLQLSMANQLMGTGPSFEFHAQQSYTSNAGVLSTMNIKLNACKGSKLSWPFKNTDYTIQDFDFTAFADASNNWGVISFSE
jgi:hypothetical protein